MAKISKTAMKKVVRATKSSKTTKSGLGGLAKGGIALGKKVLGFGGKGKGGAKKIGAKQKLKRAYERKALRLIAQGNLGQARRLLRKKATVV